MPFGLCNAPATFQATMDSILRDDKWRIAIPYLDDVIIYSNSIEEHQEYLKKVLGKLEGAVLVLNAEKCKFFKDKIEYLGQIITAGKIKPDPKRIQAILEFNPPITIRDLRSFLGLSNFCSEYIPNYATLTAELTELLKGENLKSQREIEWSIESNLAFEKTKIEISKIT